MIKDKINIQSHLLSTLNFRHQVFENTVKFRCMIIHVIVCSSGVVRWRPRGPCPYLSAPHIGMQLNNVLVTACNTYRKTLCKIFRKINIFIFVWNPYNINLMHDVSIYIVQSRKKLSILYLTWMWRHVVCNDVRVIFSKTSVFSRDSKKYNKYTAVVLIPFLKTRL